LEDGSYRRVGSTLELVCDARIVSSSNAEPPALVADGRFRADLYYRLNAIELHIPPLRTRREDIVPLAEHYLAQFARSAGHQVPTLTPQRERHCTTTIGREMSVSCATGWNARLAYQPGAPQLPAQAIFPEQALLDHPGERVARLAEARERADRLHIEEAKRQTGGKIVKAAVLLGISRTTL